MDNYKIEIMLCPDTTIYPEKPYFWCLYKFSSDGYTLNNKKYGWSINPDEAWNEAKSVYESMLRSRYSEASTHDEFDEMNVSELLMYCKLHNIPVYTFVEDQIRERIRSFNKTVN